MINFQYDKNLEFDNLQHGLGSLNHGGKPSPIVQLMLDKEINLDDKKQVNDYFKKFSIKKEINISEEIKKTKRNWLKIEKEVKLRLDKIFKYSINFNNIIAYLTLNTRSGYNIQQNYFYVSIFSKNQNAGIIHELLHFYTHKALLQKFIDKKISKNDFNDYKESLTFLINGNFSDLIPDFVDTGYLKQKKLRNYLISVWQKNQDIKKLTDIFINEYLKR